MLAIVYDLEMTVKRKKGEMAEIIEIGAVKVALEEDKPVIVDTFQAFVKPTKIVLTADTISFTGITQADVNEADCLQDVIDRFIGWIGTADYALCSWGPDDKAQFARECRTKRIALDWLRNHNNVQQPVSLAMGRPKNQQIGLKSALEVLNIEFVGSHHRAIDDAYNTALIYIHMFEHIHLERNHINDHPAYETKVVYRGANEDEEDNVSPFAALANWTPQNDHK
ncbi:3'-5' exonuclease [Paenibacillus sp. 481]|uniref:3'-5' exonuclease n=1 Tax=Paenibacillus sp. 481 TaxID=2835869 RepID=UPI001E44CD6C|nr:3'-5' exonuclease [Paenibacillus sp. 481]UHA72382.1 exonuclease domain-containing protein [Paenibacillus sp. 481]